MSSKSLLDFSPLSQPQKRHVARVYAALLVNVLMTGVGVYAQLYLLRLPSFLALLLSMACVVGLSSSSDPKVCAYCHAPNLSSHLSGLSSLCKLGCNPVWCIVSHLFDADTYTKPRGNVWSIWVT